MEKKKVVSIVLNNFTNDSRVLKENKSLQTAGYDVKVIALNDMDLPEYESVEGLYVHRINLRSRKWPKHFFIKILKYIEFVYKFVQNYKESDIIHCNDLNTLPIGYIVKVFFNPQVKIVYDAHEYETQTHWIKGLRKTAYKVTERFLIPYADAMITVSDSIANEYVRLYSIKKPALVLNTPPYRTIEKKDYFRELLNIGLDKKIFLYQGGFTKGRGIEILLDTFKKLVDTNNVIVFMGYGVLENTIIEAADKYESIYFHEAVPPNILLEYTCSADFGILFYENTCLNHYYCSPNKMFEYIMAEIPVIASNLYEMKRLVEKYSIGVVAEENTVEGLMHAIKKASTLDYEELKSHIGVVKEQYNWEEQEKVLLDLYRGLR